MYRKNIQTLLILLSIFILAFISKGLNIPNLGDKILIGPDPYLFYRYTYQLYYNGTLPYNDTLRYYPFGYTLDRRPLLAVVGYLFERLLNNIYVYGFFKGIYGIFNLNLSTSSFDFIIQLTPAILFAIASILFYFFSRYFLDDKESILATILFVLTPIVTMRIVGGLYDKEAIALPAILITLITYFYTRLSANNPKTKVILYLLTSLLIAISGISWGGWVIILLTISVVEALLILANEEYDSYIGILLLFMPIYAYLNIAFKLFSSMLIPINLVVHSTFGIAFIAIVAIEYLLLILKRLGLDEKLSSKFKINKRYIPILIFAIFILLGSPVIISKISYVLSNPWATRFGSSVEEQQPATFQYWRDIVGIPIVAIVYLAIALKLIEGSREKYQKILDITLPLIFSIVLVSSMHIIYTWLTAFAVLFYYILKSIYYNRRFESEDILIVLTVLYLAIADYIIRLLFILSFILPITLVFGLRILDRYLNSKYDNRYVAFLPVLGLLFFVIHYIVNPEVKSILVGILGGPFGNFFNNLCLGYLLSSPLSPVILIGGLLLVILLTYSLLDIKNNAVTTLILVLLLFAGSPPLISGLITYQYLPDKSYYESWVKLGIWISYYTEKNSIFIHWWDYGYLVQTLGKRATIVDGGNAYPYWNHLVGRYVLCGNSSTALEFLYAHTNGKPTYLLVDPTDIGKFYQFSRLGSNENYDKLSTIGFAQIGAIYGNRIIWTGPGNSLFGSSIINPLDEDIEINGKVYRRCVPDLGRSFPNGCSAVGGIIIETRGNITDSQLIFYNKIPINASQIIAIPTKDGKYQYKIPPYSIVKNFSIDWEKLEIEGAKLDIITYNPFTKDFDHIYYPLRCISIYDKVIYNNSKGYGCLYIVKCSPRYPKTFCAYFISNKAMRYLWIQLYFFNKDIPYFKKVLETSDLYFIDSRVIPWKIWKVKYPENITVPSYKKCIYLARNLREVNICRAKYGLPPVRSYYEV